MATTFQTIQEPLHKEIKVLDSLIYRSKNQHKSSVMLRKMIHLKRLLRIQRLSPSNKVRISDCAKSLYVAATSSLSMGFFVPLCLCVLGVSARIFYLIDKCRVEYEKNLIDDIFAELE